MWRRERPHASWGMTVSWTVISLGAWVIALWVYGSRELVGIGHNTARYPLNPRMFAALGIPLVLTGFWLGALVRRVRIELEARRHRRYVKRVLEERERRERRRAPHHG